MSDGFIVSMEKNDVELDFLRSTGTLQQILINMNTGTPFVCKVNGEIVAECLVCARDGYHEISNYAADDDDFLRKAIEHIINYYRENGGSYVDIGCGNAFINLFTMFQRLGFRIVAVWPDYLLGDSKVPAVENAIINRDMIRFRINLNENTLITTGYDASGRQ